ncbi:hypothetical protein [Eisenbergiella sp.]
MGKDAARRQWEEKLLWIAAWMELMALDGGQEGFACGSTDSTDN